MAFQLVRAGDDDIAIWQTDHGHIYVFQVAPDRSALVPVTVREAPDAAAPAQAFADAALRFATGEAQARRLLNQRAGRAAGRRGSVAHA